MTHDEALLCINKVCTEYPTLTGFGLENKNGPKKTSHTDIPTSEFITCVEWLLKKELDRPRRVTVNEKLSSYTWKHIVEREEQQYICNGAFICAALYLGYKKKSRGPNAWFNLHQPPKRK